MIDFHSHVLPGIDDGSKDLNMSLAMLAEMEKQGVTTCVATPHFYPYRRSLESFLARRNPAVDALQSAWKGQLQLRIGAEVALCSELTRFTDAELNSLCINDTRVLLLEMPFTQWSEHEVDLVSELCLERGYHIILAHLERFLELQEDTFAMEQLLLLPLDVQLNAECLLSLWHRKPYLTMFREGTAHLLGSDCHNLSDRKPNLLAARRVLEKKLGLRMLDVIDHRGQQLLSPNRIGSVK